MKCPYISKSTPRRVCEEIDALCEEAGMKMSRRPWNRFKADSTAWWLVPSDKQPHYRYGKYCFDWGDEKFESIIAGFYIEKGLDESLSSVYPSKRGANLMMKSDWTWNAFMKDLRSGKFRETIMALSDAVPFNVEFHIEGGYVDDPAIYDPHASNLGNDIYSLEMDKKNGISVMKALRKGMQLKILNRANNLDALIETVCNFASDKWLWLNFMTGLRLLSPREGDAPAGADLWNAQNLRDKCLRYFTEWIK